MAEMLAVALEEGMRTLKMDGMEKVPDGHHRHDASARGLHQVTAAPGAHERLDCRKHAGPAAARARRRGRRKTSCQRLEQLNAIGASLSAERDINRLLESILIAAKKITRADGGTLYRVTEERHSCASRSCAPTRSVSPWAAPPARRCRSTRSSCTARTASRTTDGGGLRGAHRQDGQHRRRLHRRGLRLLRHAQLRQEDRLPLEVVPHGADEEPRERDHRRAAADQRHGPGDAARSCRSPTPTSASPNRSPRRRPSRSPTGMLINQLEELFESFINLINTAIDDKSPYTGGHCQRVPHAHDDARRSGERRRNEGPLAAFQHDRQGPLRAEDRRPAARLRQGHDAGARGGQGDQAADHLRPHPPHRHALRGAQARRRDRAAEGQGAAGARAARCAARARCRRCEASRAHAPARRRSRVPARLQHRRRGDAPRTTGARQGDRPATRWTDMSGHEANFLTRGRARRTSPSAPAR